MTRISKRELFEVLGYQPHPGQLQVHRSAAKYRILCAGVRWGKSQCAAMECTSALLAPGDGVIGWVVAPTLGLASLVFELTCMALRTHFAHRVVEFDTREHRIVVTNLGGGRSELRAMTADNPTSLLGVGLSFLIVDEAARVRQGVWERYLAPRLIDRDGWCLMISTPGKRDWFFKIWKRGFRGLDPDYEGWRFPSSANPYLDPAVLEAARQSHAEPVFRQEYEAVFEDEDLEPCEVCNGPKPGGRRSTVWFDDGPPRCPHCGDLTDEDGESIVAVDRDGRRAQLRILKLDSRSGQRRLPPGDAETLGP